MQNPPLKQVTDLLTRSSNILIALPSHPSTDAVAGGLALFLALEKLGKKTKVVCNDFDLPPHHQFLPKSKEIHTDLTALRKFVITVDMTRTKVEELSYDIAGDKLNIYLTPKNGFYEPRDVTTSVSEYEYDLVVTLDCPDMESLGKLFEQNAEFFYHTPTINIDHNAANEHYGQVNYIELVATSTSEILFDVIKALGPQLLDEYIATGLLTGIISKTKSFQTNSVTPRSLSVASYLIEQGARRDEIIKHLYRTKSVTTLKLWGRTLARLRTDMDGRIVWSVLNRQDFERSGADDSELPGVIDELIINMPQAEVMMLMYEQADQKIGVIANTVRTVDALTILGPFGPTGTSRYATCALPGTTLAEAERKVLEAVRAELLAR